MTAAKTAAEKKLAEREAAGRTVEEGAAEAQAPALPEVEDGDRDEQIGLVRGRDIDPTFPTVLFTDPHTGEVIENVPTVHDVPVGTNSDGSVKWAKATDVMYAHAKDSKGK